MPVQKIEREGTSTSRELSNVMGFLLGNCCLTEAHVQEALKRRKHLEKTLKERRKRYTIQKLMKR